MALFLRRDMPHWWRKGSLVFLAFSWLTGLLAGAASAYTAGDILFPLMRSAPGCSVSIVSLLCVACFPFLISAFAVFISQPWLLLAVSFGKAFCFALVSTGILASYGSGGWLLRWLLCFSDCAVLPLLYWYWMRYISGDRAFSGPETGLALCLGLLIASADHHFIVPLLARLTDF